MEPLPGNTAEPSRWLVALVALVVVPARLVFNVVSRGARFVQRFVLDPLFDLLDGGLIRALDWLFDRIKAGVLKTVRWLWRRLPVLWLVRRAIVALWLPLVERVLAPALSWVVDSALPPVARAVGRTVRGLLPMLRWAGVRLRHLADRLLAASKRAWRFAVGAARWTYRSVLRPVSAAVAWIWRHTATPAGTAVAWTWRHTATPAGAAVARAWRVVVLPPARRVHRAMEPTLGWIEGRSPHTDDDKASDEEPHRPP